jgi:type VI secretion system Hcp family effector
MAINAYITLEGIQGGSDAAGHEAQIEILSWNHSFIQPTSATRSVSGSGTVEAATHNDFSFTKYISSATDDLLKHCWSGLQIPSVTFTCYRADGSTENQPVEYLKVVMQNVVVSSFAISGGAGDLPIEEIALNYSYVQYVYTPQKREDGTGGEAQPISHDLATKSIA